MSEIAHIIAVEVGIDNIGYAISPIRVDEPEIESGLIKLMPDVSPDSRFKHLVLDLYALLSRHKVTRAIIGKPSVRRHTENVEEISITVANNLSKMSANWSVCALVLGIKNIDIDYRNGEERDRRVRVDANAVSTLKRFFKEISDDV